MTDAERTTGMETAADGIADLFSIDADAHLQKLASCMFPTSAQLPVELVRAALKRKAAAVAVEIRRSQLVIEDDGDGIEPDQWHELACALDSRCGAAEREKAITALQKASDPGIGLLAVFVPGVETIRLESSGRDGRSAMQASAGEVRQAGAGAGRRGTRIAITRRGGPFEAEKKLLKELCAAVSAEITLNGQKIVRKPVLRRTLVQQQVDIGTGKGTVLVAVPAQGDICRIWLLDQRIPWQVVTSASCHGLVFDAALESASPATAAAFNQLAAAAGRLYQWLADHYPSFPPRYQERIEELIFKKVKAAGDLRLLSSFAPFQLWRCKQRLTLEEVRRKAERGPLVALPIDGDPKRFLASHQEALLLTPAQRDFLLNHVGLPLVTPAASIKSPGRMAQLADTVRSLASLLAARLAAFLLRRRFKALDAKNLSAIEIRLCRELEFYSQGRQYHVSPFPLRVAMASGRGLAAAAWRRGAMGSVLFLRRRHPLVQAAVRSVARDRANVELAFAALVPSHFLTAGRH